MTDDERRQARTDASIGLIKLDRELRKRFGRCLKELRERRCLSYREAARIAEIDVAYLYRLEKGVKEHPSREVVTRLQRLR